MTIENRERRLGWLRITARIPAHSAARPTHQHKTLAGLGAAMGPQVLRHSVGTRAVMPASSERQPVTEAGTIAADVLMVASAEHYLDAVREHGYDECKRGSLHNVVGRVGLLFSRDSDHPLSSSEQPTNAEAGHMRSHECQREVLRLQH